MGRYNSMSIIKPLEFSSIFHRGCRVSTKKVLAKMSREEVAILAVTLNRLYCNQTPESVINMLHENDPKRKLLNRLVRNAVEKDLQRGYKDVVAFDIMPLEILRIAFSLEPNLMKHKLDEDLNRLQFSLVKCITQINEDLMHFTLKEKDEKQIAKLIMVNSASYNDLLKNDEDAYIYQAAQSILFFEFLESTAKYKELLNAFNEQFGIQSWKEYVRTVYSIAIMSYIKDTGILPKTIETEPPGLLSMPVLDALSIDVENKPIPYSSKDEFDKEGNSDFRRFKSCPLLRLSNGNYIIHNTKILIDRLYSSLYYDFQNIAEDCKGKYPDVSGLFTEQFVEKTLFAGLMQDCISGGRYDSYSEDKLKIIYKIKEGEPGYPDYYLRNRESKATILFECKDIRINAWVKEKRNYSALEEELRNKIVVKTYKLDQKEKCRKTVESKRIGTGQLAAHIVNIRKNQFPWDITIPKDITIYPVLVIADNRLIFDGLPYLAQQWYEERLKEEGGESNSSRPLIMMSPLTLLKYKPLFLNKGFEYYFEAYYASLSEDRVGTIVDIINRIVSFDDFMKQFPFSIEPVSLKIKETLYSDEGFQSIHF